MLTEDCCILDIQSKFWPFTERLLDVWVLTQGCVGTQPRFYPFCCYLMLALFQDMLGSHLLETFKKLSNFLSIFSDSYVSDSSDSIPYEWSDDEMNLYNKHKSRNKLPCKLPIYYAYFELNSFKGRERDSWRTCLHLHLCISAKVTRGEERWEKDKKKTKKRQKIW